MSIRLACSMLIYAATLCSCASKMQVFSNASDYQRYMGRAVDAALRHCTAMPGPDNSLNVASTISFTIGSNGRLKDDFSYQSQNEAFKPWSNCIGTYLKKGQFSYPPGNQDYLFQTSVNWDVVTEEKKKIDQERALVKVAIEGHVEDFQRCYDSYLTRGKNTGKVMLNFSIMPDGKVTNNHATSNDFQDDYFSLCLESVVSTIDFTPHGNVAIDLVRYPLSFGTR